MKQMKGENVVHCNVRVKALIEQLIGMREVPEEERIDWLISRLHPSIKANV